MVKWVSQLGTHTLTWDGPRRRVCWMETGGLGNKLYCSKYAQGSFKEAFTNRQGLVEGEGLLLCQEARKVDRQVRRPTFVAILSQEIHLRWRQCFESEPLQYADRE